MQTPHPTTSAGARARLASAFDHGGEHIGDLAWPELHLAGTTLGRDELRALLEEEALPPEWAPEDPSGQKAFGRALGKCANLDAAPNISIERELLRSRVALVRHSTGNGLSKTTTTWARVHVNDLDEIEVEWSDAPAVQAAIDGSIPNVVLEHARAALTVLNTEYDRLMSYVDTAELGEMVVHVLTKELKAIRIRRDGGLYYVHTTSADRMRAFARVVAKTGASALPFIPAFDTPEGRASLGRSINETLQGEITAVVKGLAKLGTDSKKPRESSLHARLEELDALSARAESCRLVLEAYADDIARSVADAKKQVTDMLELHELEEEAIDG